MVVERKPWTGRGQGQYIGVLARRQREGCGLNNLRYMDGDSFSLSASRLVSLSLSLSLTFPPSLSLTLYLSCPPPLLSLSLSPFQRVWRKKTDGYSKISKTQGWQKNSKSHG